jgi:hypothetical protein
VYDIEKHTIRPRKSVTLDKKELTARDRSPICDIWDNRDTNPRILNFANKRRGWSSCSTPAYLKAVCTQGLDDLNVVYAYGRGYLGARTDTTQQSGQTPDKKVEINHITVFVSGYLETDPTGMLSPNNYRLSGPPKNGSVSSRQPGQTPATVCIEYQSLQWKNAHSVLFSELIRKLCKLSCTVSNILHQFLIPKADASTVFFC